MTSRRPDPPPRGLRLASAWWPLGREIALFIAGLFLILVESTHESPRATIIIVGMTLLGYPLASVLDRALGGSKP